LEVVEGQLLTDGPLPGMWGAFYRPEQQIAIIQCESTMKKDRKEVASSEPLGIIISRGDKTEPTPVFSAYIWGPVPEAVQDSATKAA
jgi:hypothetical protein